MSEQPSGKPATFTRREVIGGAIGAAGVAITAGIAVNDKIEEERKNAAVRSRITTFKNGFLEEGRIKQQALQKASQPTPSPTTIPAAIPTPEIVSTEPEKPYTVLGYFKEGFTPNEFVELSQMIKQQEDKLDSIGINSARIQSYNERFKPMVDKILPLAGEVADIALNPEFQDLFHCLILAESIGNPDAVSRVGAIGLAQVMPIGAMDSLLVVGDVVKRKPEIQLLWDLVRRSNPITAKIVNPKDFDPTKIKVEDFKKQNMINPEVNIALGAVQFVMLIDRFDGNIGMAISAYNAGSGKIKSAVNKYWELEGNPPIMPTNKPNFIEVFKKRKELGLEDENNENWVYLPRILAIYRKIHGPHVFPLAA